MLSAADCIPVRKLLIVGYKILVGYQGRGAMGALSLDKGEDFITGRVEYCWYIEMIKSR